MLKKIMMNFIELCLLRNRFTNRNRFLNKNRFFRWNRFLWGIDSFEESIPFSPIHLTGRLKESGFTIPDFEESTQHYIKWKIQYPTQRSGIHSNRNGSMKLTYTHGIIAIRKMFPWSMADDLEWRFASSFRPTHDSFTRSRTHLRSRPAMAWK